MNSPSQSRNHIPTTDGELPALPPNKEILASAIRMTNITRFIHLLSHAKALITHHGPYTTLPATSVFTRSLKPRRPAYPSSPSLKNLALSLAAAQDSTYSAQPPSRTKSDLDFFTLLWDSSIVVLEEVLSIGDLPQESFGWGIFAPSNPSLQLKTMQDAGMLTPSPVVQDAMFFTLLNRDVRMSIYDFLYGWLPPLPYKKRWHKEDDCRGMALACKQGNLELSEAAARHLKMFFDEFSNDFEKECGHPISLYGSIPLHQGWKALQSVTFTLDISFFDEALAELAMIPEAEKDNWRREEASEDLKLHAGTGWRGEILQWRALLLHPFDKVTLLITDASKDVDDLTSTHIEKYLSVIAMLRDSLNTMGENCGHDWLMFQNSLDWDAICKEEHEAPDRFFNKYDEYDSTPKRKWYKTAELFRFARVQHERLNDRGMRKYIGKQAARDYIRTGQRIQTKQVCFAWNFLASGKPTPKKLVGKMHTYTAQHAGKMRRKDQLRELKYENMWPHKYEVVAADGIVGEMGIRHPKRWVLASEEHTEYYGFMGQLKEAEDVESKGIGMSLWRGRPKAEKGEGEEGVEETAEMQAEREIDGDVQEEIKEDVVIEIEEEMWEESESEDDSDEDDEDGDEDDDEDDDEDTEEDSEGEDDDEGEDQAEIEDEDGPGFQPVLRGGKQTKIPDYWKKA
ncbi:hypothetical protein J4E89_006114 [Alternaria sp. Ai002NY15]|nr:hypothetical protein J4E89_006114 [Alternaria sp. Ai002NY15]